MGGLCLLMKDLSLFTFVADSNKSAIISTILYLLPICALARHILCLILCQISPPFYSICHCGNKLHTGISWWQLISTVPCVFPVFPLGHLCCSHVRNVQEYILYSGTYTNLEMGSR